MKHKKKLQKKFACYVQCLSKSINRKTVLKKCLLLNLKILILKFKIGKKKFCIFYIFQTISKRQEKNIKKVVLNQQGGGGTLTLRFDHYFFMCMFPNWLPCPHNAIAKIPLEACARFKKFIIEVREGVKKLDFQRHGHFQGGGGGRPTSR